MRIFLALLLVLGFAAAPAIAQEEEADPVWVGVWEGTIGTYPVIMCLDRWYHGDGKGSYYYLSQMKPIPLRGDEGENRWIEGGYNGVAGSKEMPALDFTDVSADRITGVWRAGERRLRISLDRIPDGAEDYYDACGSVNFLAPRVVAPEFTREEARIEGLSYTRLTYQVPPRFEDVGISGFTFEPQQPGDGKILEWLAAKLPQGKVEDEFLQCLSGALGMHGTDGYYEMGLGPDFANAELMSISSGNSSYCGGAHPNHWSEYYTFDRQSGELLDPFDWFNADGVGETEHGSKIMMPPLRAAILVRWPQYPEFEEDPGDCSGFAIEQEWWYYQLRRDGIQFEPDFPHVITACEERVLVPWAELDPFLSEVGKTLRDRAQR
jgi:hypothetical protein